MFATASTITLYLLIQDLNSQYPESVKNTLN